MAAVVPFPKGAAFLLDARGEGRALRITSHGHGDAATIVLSVWRDDVCTASFRLPAEEAPALIAALQSLSVDVAPATTQVS